MTDSRFESCIALIRQGSTEGLKEIYEAYYKLIYSVMYSVTGSSTSSEDLTADFFVKLWDKLAESYRFGGGHKSWLASCARNMAADSLRKSGRELFTLDDEDAHRPEPASEDFTEGVISDLTVQQALSRLTETERTIISLKLFSDFTFMQISKALAMPLGTVTWKYRRAISTLKKHMEEVQNL